MRLSKLTLTLGLTGLLAANPLFAKDTTTLSTAEKGTLASIAVIDKNEILVSVLASNKKVDSGVADFAKMMIEQHGSNLTQLIEIANRSHVESLSGGAAEKLASEGKKEMMKLGSLQGNEFDKAYVDAMVKGHQAALDLIKNHLMKTAKNEELKKFLTETQSAVETHLEDAKKLQEKMKG